MNDWRQNMDPEMRLIFSNLENEVGRIKDALVGAQSRLMVECVFWRISTVIGIFTQTQVPAEVWQKAWRLYEVADWARQIVDRTWIGDNAEYQQCLDWFEDHGGDYQLLGCLIERPYHYEPNSSSAVDTHLVNRGGSQHDTL